MRLAAGLVLLLGLACGTRPAPAPGADTTGLTRLPPDSVIPTCRPAPPEDASRQTPPSGRVSFGRDILPVLFARCVSCHSPEKRGGNYEVNSWCGVMDTGADPVPNVIPGNADSSRLYQYLVSPHPPDAPLDSTTVALFRKWIAQGARNN
jgi:hypothetical protein